MSLLVLLLLLQTWSFLLCGSNISSCTCYWLGHVQTPLSIYRHFKITKKRRKREVKSLAANSVPILCHLLHLPTASLRGPLAGVVGQLHQGSRTASTTILYCGSAPALHPLDYPARYHLAVMPHRPDVWSGTSLILPSPGLFISHRTGAIPLECLRLLDALFQPGRSSPRKLTLNTP
jgi:hypothetical protein